MEDEVVLTIDKIQTVFYDLGNIRKLGDTVNTLSISDESIDALNVRGLLERLAVVLTCRFVFQNLLNVTIIRTSKH